MVDDRPRGSCVIPGCPRDPYPDDAGHQPLACGPHVSQVRNWLIEIPRYAGELGRQLTDASMPDPRGKDISILLPSMATSAPRSGGRVSGSAEPRLPIAVDVVDLLGPRRPIVDRGEDGTGFDSIWSVLSFWCVDLAEHRGLGERGQRPNEQSPIPWLAAWLLERVDEAADDWPLFADFFSDLGRIHGALRNLLGLVDVPDYKAGVPCSKCGHLTLLRHGGRDFVECASCPYALTIPEYERYVSTLSTMLGTAAREKRRKATEDRRATVRLLRGLLAAGWRHTINYVPSERDPDGAPYHEGYLEHVWTRPGERLWAWWRIDPRQPIWSISLGAVEGDDEVDARLDVSVSWVEANGVKRLHHLAAAAGVLALPKERAA